jgi:hypothetical protein
MRMGRAQLSAKLFPKRTPLIGNYGRFGKSNGLARVVPSGITLSSLLQGAVGVR